MSGSGWPDFYFGFGNEVIFHGILGNPAVGGYNPGSLAEPFAVPD